MTKPLKITLITLLTLVVLGIIGYFVADSIISSKLEKFLKTKLPETMSVDYASIDVNIWRGNLVMVQPKFINKGRHTSTTNAEIASDSLLINGFGYWDYLVNDNIRVRSIQLRNPKILYKHDESIPGNEYKSSNLENMKQQISIGRFNIQNAEISIREMQTDSLMLHTEKLTFNVMDVVMNDASVKNPIPFNFENYDLSFNDLFLSVSDYENLTIASAQSTQKETKFEQLKIVTKYSKAKLNQIISIERDHFNVTIPSLVLQDQKFGYKEDSIFYFKSPKVIFEDSEMYIYRDKLLADDMTRKSLYSNMLRDLKFDLTLSEIKLKNASIIYSEKVNVDMPPGKLSFTNMNADIKNVSNTYGINERTTLDIDAVFMAKTPIKVSWEFDVNNVNDQFVFKAEIGKLPSPDLNPFSQPNLKVQLEGELLQTYATISGDANTSQVNMRAKYQDFKVIILDKEAQKKNKVLSAIANLFISKDSEKAEAGFRESFKDQIERDHTKSIFNFLWLNLKGGLASIMTGDGKQ